MDRALAAREYAGHLTDADLTLLALAGPGAGPGDGSRLRGDPAALLRLLEDPGTFGTVLGGELGESSRGWAVQASPFLIFALLVQRAETELASAAHVPERTGLRQRVPLFDAPALRDFLADTARRLFLTGVFPDYVTSRAFGPVDAGRLLRAAGLPGPQRERLAAGPAIEMLEHLGARWYRIACELAPVRTARLAVAGDVADRFRQARRVPHHLADRYLLAEGQPWFSAPGS